MPSLMKMLHTVGALIASWAEQNEIKNDCAIQVGRRTSSAFSPLEASCTVHILQVCAHSNWITAERRAGVCGRLVRNQVLRLGSRTLGRANLQQELSAPWYLEGQRLYSEVGWNKASDLSCWPVHMSRLLMFTWYVNNWGRIPNNLQTDSMAHSMLHLQARFL